MFYPSDWRNNANLRRCSWEARGVWIEVIGLMHDADDYGVLRWTLSEIAQALGAPLKAVRELAAKGVLKGTDKAEDECPALVYVPRSGRKEGQPVTLLRAQPGPIWYSSRMVRDEHVRTIRGEASRFGESPKASLKPPIGEPEGDGSSYSVSPSVTTSTAIAVLVPDEPEGSPEPPARLGVPDCPAGDIVETYHAALPTLPRVRVLTDARRAALRSRWREMHAAGKFRTEAEGLERFKRFFEYVGQSAFLLGDGPQRNGSPPFQADLEWLIRPANFVKVIEGRYHR